MGELKPYNAIFHRGMELFNCLEVIPMGLEPMTPTLKVLCSTN